ncbi:hypothetical protein [Nocardia bovistercoris]|uniref:ADF-H domain-containing protein n=1 Tax=Nocardia bovistercoris TaxID=2785916 RepID=A0A931N8G7_9NOCA|nr:hypothetical protein [Nocardia bovistercoris]MBH0781763.1 hypothetical protein [Nocardia bovistercoris]
MHLSLDSAHGELDDFLADRVPNRYVRLRLRDEHTISPMDDGVAASFDDLLDDLPEAEACWVLVHFGYADSDGDRIIEPVILSWAPPAMRGSAGAQLVLGARDIALRLTEPVPQILLTRRMSHQDVAQFLRSRH